MQVSGLGDSHIYEPERLSFHISILGVVRELQNVELKWPFRQARPEGMQACWLLLGGTAQPCSAPSLLWEQCKLWPCWSRSVAI